MKRYKNRNYMNKLINNMIKRNLKRLNRKLGQNLRNRINNALKHNWKSGHLLELLGCTIEFLKRYLQKQFRQGMNWKNYGKWHIDHIKPCASFDLSIPEEQRKCFNYTNLQPLWAKDNLSKKKESILYKRILK